MLTRFTRRALALGVATAALLPLAAYAQTAWPDRTIRIVVPFPPGGPLDLATRIVAGPLSQKLGQSVVVENKAGAGGNIGADAVAKSAPDGYTLLLGATSTHAVNVHLYKQIPFDPLRDFAPIVALAEVPNVLIVPAAQPATNVRDFVAAARLKPMPFGSGGNGSAGHLAGELFKMQTGAQLDHIPYAGAAPAMNALLGGETQLMFDNLASAYPQIQAGKVKALAVTTLKRAPQLPDVPTLTEGGYEFAISTWFGIFAPAGTPDAIVERLNRDIVAILAEPATKDGFAKFAAVPVGGTPKEFASFVAAENKKYGEIVKISGAKAE